MEHAVERLGAIKVHDMLKGLKWLDISKGGLVAFSGNIWEVNILGFTNHKDSVATT